MTNRSGVLGTTMPAGLLLLLIAVGLPRTILADLGLVAPESGPLYYAIALTPFGIWLLVAAIRPTPTPWRDHLLVGACYGLSLMIMHELSWLAGLPARQRPPDGAVTLADRLGPPLREVLLHGSMLAVAMMIGLGVGLVAGLTAAVAGRIRAASRPRSRPGRGPAVG